MSTETLENSAKAVTAPTASEPPLTDHTYDGIQEYDNPMPGWWKWLFAGTVTFSFFYFFIVTMSGNQMGAIADYEHAQTEELKKQFGGQQLNGDAATLLRLSMDPKINNVGASIFATNCVTCHGRDAD